MRTTAGALVVVALLTAYPGGASAEPARIVEAADLHAAPDPGSRRIAELAADTPVDRTGRRGGWIAVRPPDGEAGWVRVWKVREVESGEGLLGALERFGRQVTGYFSGDSGAGEGTGSVTATIGVRGLGGRGGQQVDAGHEPLGGAAADAAALRAVRAHAVSAAAARTFAERAALRARPAIRTPGAGVGEAEDWSGW